MSLAAQSLGTPALPPADRGDLHLLVGRPGRDRDPVRVQLQPLAHELGRLLAALVLRRPRPQRLERPGAAGRAQAHAPAGRHLRRRRHAARCRARPRPAALARAGQRLGQRAHAAAARHARDRDGRRAAAAVPAGLQRDRHRHDGAGDRSDHVHDLVRGRDGARPPGLDRTGVRGGRRRPRARRPSTCSTACCCRCSRRPSWPAPRWSSRSRSTTSSSPSTSSGDASTTTVSMLLYSSARGAPTPALNALATIALLITLGTLALVFLVYRRFAGARRRRSGRRRPGGVADAGRNPARVARQVVRPTSSPSMASTCTCRPASSSRWSGRRAAARRRRCA